MDKRWRCDGEAAKKKRNQSGGKAVSDLIIPKILVIRGKKRGFPRKAMGIFLGGIVFFVYLCTQKEQTKRRE